MTVLAISLFCHWYLHEASTTGTWPTVPSHFSTAGRTFSIEVERLLLPNSFFMSCCFRTRAEVVHEEGTAHGRGSHSSGEPLRPCTFLGTAIRKQPARLHSCTQAMTCTRKVSHVASIYKLEGNAPAFALGAAFSMHMSFENCQAHNRAGEYTYRPEIDDTNVGIFSS